MKDEEINMWKLVDGKLVKVPDIQTTTSGSQFVRNPNGTTTDQYGTFNSDGSPGSPGSPTPQAGLTGFQGVQLALGGVNALLGFKQYGLAKDTFAHNKRMAEANYAANRVQANNLIDRGNTINQGVTSKANSLARAAGGSGNQVYKKKALVAGL